MVSHLKILRVTHDDASADWDLYQSRDGDTFWNSKSTEVPLYVHQLFEKARQATIKADDERAKKRARKVDETPDSNQAKGTATRFIFVVKWFSSTGEMHKCFFLQLVLVL